MKLINQNGTQKNCPEEIFFLHVTTQATNGFNPPAFSFAFTTLADAENALTKISATTTAHFARFTTITGTVVINVSAIVHAEIESSKDHDVFDSWAKKLGLRK